MPRRPRLHVPGGLYHVTLRGNDRQPLFFADSDRRLWMKLLADGLEQYRCRRHAYCWMTHHVHMAVQVSGLPLGSLIRWVAPQYAGATNKRLKPCGHLFERRYGARLVDADSYLLQLVRYIHLNPVGAGMAKDPALYPWSSHCASLGHTPAGFLTMDWVPSFFGRRRNAARQACARFMAQAADAPETLLTGNIDDDRVVGPCNVDGEDSHSSDIVHPTCTLDDLASPSRTHRHARLRAEIAKAAVEQSIAAVTDVAKRFNRSTAAISRQAWLMAVPPLSPKPAPQEPQPAGICISVVMNSAAAALAGIFRSALTGGRPGTLAGPAAPSTASSERR